MTNLNVIPLRLRNFFIECYIFTRFLFFHFLLPLPFLFLVLLLLLLLLVLLFSLSLLLLTSLLLVNLSPSQDIQRVFFRQEIGAVDRKTSWFYMSWSGFQASASSHLHVREIDDFDNFLGFLSTKWTRLRSWSQQQMRNSN